MQYVTILAGHSFRPQEAKAALSFLEPGAALRLERDPANPYDPSAIKIIDNEFSEFIGFVAAADNKDLAMILDARTGDSSAERYGLIQPGHEPQVTRCEILDFTHGRTKPTIVIEVTTGFELGTLVRGPDEDGSGEPDYLPNE